ncbi:MAG: PBP1A family penicillin-binding protein [Myxococcota bacterium]|jgi:penicillin-binding protein 1A|nr:PBP1A family penicillin-binding protein [Myxococcota bacterium]
MPPKKPSAKGRSAKAESSRKRPKSKKKTKRQSSLAWKIARFLILASLLLSVLGVGAVSAVLWFYARDLPQVFSAADYHPKQITRIYDRHGKLLAELFEERRTVVPVEQIPELMRYAIIAAEDANFYEHKGLDYIGVLRAAYTNIQRGSYSHGASTLTQQVVKNLLLTPEKQIKRKIQEVLLARQLEESLSKDEILAIYLNHAYFGHRTYGIQEAARYYFSRDVGELDLSQAATLAGMVQSPQRLSPLKHLERCTERRNYVLGQMRDKGFITEADYREALEAPIVVQRQDPPSLGAAPHFVEQVKKMLIDEYGEEYLYTAGLEIYTSIDIELQWLAEEALRKGLREYDARHGLYRPLDPKRHKPDTQTERLLPGQRYVGTVTSATTDTLEVRVGTFTLPVQLIPRSRVLATGDTPKDCFEPGQLLSVELGGTGENGEPVNLSLSHGPDGAIVVIDPRSRHVLASVGGYHYGQSRFDRALQARRQTGSSFKPLVFAAALDARLITPASIIDDAPKVFHIPGRSEPWSPRNFDGKFKGPMSVRDALAQSRNTVAVDILERVGLEQAIDFSHRIGITSPLVENYTLALGSADLTPVEMTNAFATFASGGMLAEPVFVSRVQTVEGDLLYLEQSKAQRVISEDTAYLITSLLRSVVTDGTARAALAKWEHFAAGKTGTTNGPKDTWFVGYTPLLVAGVYVGYDEPRELGKKEGGGKTALPIWADFMKSAHQNRSPTDYPRPPGIIEIAIDPRNGLLAPPGMKGARRELFAAGTAPTQTSPLDEGLSNNDWLLKQFEESTQVESPLPDEASGSDSAPEQARPDGAASDDF